MRAPESVRNEALKRAIARKADTPEYVDECLRTAYVLEQSKKLPTPAEVFELLTGCPLELRDEPAAVDEPELSVDADWWAAEGDALTDAFEAALGWEA